MILSQPSLDQAAFFDLCEKVVESCGFALVDVKLDHRGKLSVFEVTIFTPARNISLDDCERVSRKLEEVLDSVVLGEEPYVLEVQSPGIGRKLKTERDLQVFAGQQVQVKVKENIPNLGDTFEARLLKHSNNTVTVANAKSSILSDKKANKKKISTTPEVPELTLELDQIFSVSLSMPHTNCSVDYDQESSELAKLALKN